MTARLSFIAHAATEAQRQAAFPLDEPITEREQARIAALGRNIPKAEQIWSGPELRTQQTSRMLGFSAMIADGLRDCDYGRWRGRKMEEVEHEDPQGFLAWLAEPNSAPHGGESVERLIGRVGSWMAERSGVKHTIAVTHPSVIRAALVYALHLPPLNFWRFDIAPLTLTDLRFNRDVWTVRCAGCSLSTTGQAQDEEAGIS
ncbi:MAG TPA: histidine phosphatase family protein [Terracidiphilus sp.]|jgi:broad specificity phosphatase PhoE